MGSDGIDAPIISELPALAEALLPAIMQPERLDDGAGDHVVMRGHRLADALVLLEPVVEAPGKELFCTQPYPIAP